MARAKAETKAEQALEEGVRPGAIASLVSDEKPGAVAQLERKGFDLAQSITKATQMAANLVGAAEADLGRIEEEVLSLAAGTLTTDQLVAKYGLTTDAEGARKMAQLAQVATSIQVKIKEVEVQTQGLELERTKLLRAKKTFQVIGTAAEVQDAANDAQHKWQVTEVNAEGRADELDYRKEKRSLTKTNYDGEIAYRNSWNELEESDRRSRLSHKEQMNQLFDRLRTATRGVLEAKVNKRTFTANADLGVNNSGGQA
jgi:hypothetical protein